MLLKFLLLLAINLIVLVFTTISTHDKWVQIVQRDLPALSFRACSPYSSLICYTHFKELFQIGEDIREKVVSSEQGRNNTATSDSTHLHLQPRQLACLQIRGALAHRTCHLPRSNGNAPSTRKATILTLKTDNEAKKCLSTSSPMPQNTHN